MIQEVKCRTLVGHKNIDFYVTCLKSFVEKSSQPIRLEMFQDDTLTQEDKYKIKTILPNSIIINKKDRNEIVLEKLSRYPNSVKWRARDFFSAKFFDTILYDNSNFLYIDSDIFFTKRFKLPSFGDSYIFMRDTFSGYAFSPLDFLRIKEPVFAKVNAGFNYSPIELFDLDFIESILSNEHILKCFYGKWGGFAEQTLWALLTARQKSINFFDPVQVAMAQDMKLVNETIAVHLTTPFRYKFEQLKDIKVHIDESHYENILLQSKSTYMGKYEYIAEWTLNKIKSKTTKLVQHKRV